MSENNYLIKKFPQLGDELNKIDYLIITFSLCISLYPRLSYNALAIKVGEEILYLNYKNKYLRKRKNKQNKEKNTSLLISFPPPPLWGRKAAGLLPSPHRGGGWLSVP